MDIVNQVNEKRESRILFATMGIVDYLHFQPKDVTDELSEEIFLDYLKEIDQSKRFLTKQDIALLQKHKFEIDDQIEAFNFSFFNEAEDLIEAGIQRSHDIYQSVIAGDLAIDELEVLELDAEKRDYAADAVGLADVWRKYMKFSVVAKNSRTRHFDRFSIRIRDQGESTKRCQKNFR
jgi:carboxyl-terminal processing protease